ncbi:MAG TPA: hypothetical protein VH458_06575, partial [Vicinamibacterales bacterium]
MKQLLLGLAITSVSLGSPTPGLRHEPQARPTVQGTWRSDSNNYWTRTDGKRWVSLQIERDGNTTGFGIPEDQAPALGDTRASGPVHFTLARDAGTFVFDGEITSGRGSGRFQFTSDPAFVSGMAQLGYANLSDDDIWRFAVHDVSRAYVQGLQREGVRNVAAGDLVKMKI